MSNPRRKHGRTRNRMSSCFVAEEPDSSNVFCEWPADLGCVNNYYEISKWTADGQECAGVAPDTLLPIRKVFVGNLHEKTSGYDLRNFFRRFGKIIDTHISRDQKTGFRRNYGFVTFQNPCDAASAINTPPDELWLHGRDLRVAPADAWHQPEEMPDGRIVAARQRKNRKLPPRNESEIRIDPRLIEARKQSSREVDERLCHVHILNDDCLMHVFSFLNKKERVKIERVCKRWQEVSRGTWKYLQHLDFANMCNPSEGPYPNVVILRSLLERCGPNLSSLDLSYRPNDFNSRILSTVAKLAPNLRCLNVSSLPLVSHSMRRLSEVSHQLQRLNLDSCAGVQDRDLRSLFEHCPQLESVVLSHNNQITGRCLAGLADTKLSELVLDDCNNLRSRFLATGLNKLKTLTHLSVNSCVNLTSSDIIEILQSLTQLKFLSIGRYFPLVSSTALCSLEHLRDLVSLNLQHNPAVNDEVVSIIARHCEKLMKLNVTGCTVQNATADNATLTNKGFRALARLPHLVDLSMSYLAIVTDEALDIVADKGKLRRLECRGCPTFTDAGCMRVVALCGELEYFDFCGCDHVSNATIETALEAVKERSNNVKLTLMAGGTKVGNRRFDHPLLEVNMLDLCLAHMRPDFVDDVYFQSSDNEDDDDDDDNDDYVGGLMEFAWESQSVNSSDIEWDRYSFYSYDGYDCFDEAEWN